MGPNVILLGILGYLAGGGGGWVVLQLSDWAHLAYQLSSYLYQSTYNIWKQTHSRFCKLSRSQIII